MRPPEKFRKPKSRVNISRLMANANKASAGQPVNPEFFGWVIDAAEELKWLRFYYDMQGNKRE